MSLGSDPGQIREMLAAAEGYAVFDRQGARIGAFVELTSAGDRIAIRHDGVFVWRRRLLPITNVATVLPDQRAVVLTVEGRTLAGTEAPPTPARGASGSVQENPHSSKDWQDRIVQYVAQLESPADRADINRGGAQQDPSPHAEDRAHPAAPEADQPTPEPGRRDQRTSERHLLFVSTSGGYTLVEREGAAPPLGRGIEMPEQTVSFLVTKLGPSPLPNDPRICAYLERTE